MKWMFAILITMSLFPFLALAAGGQTGSGMNGCWVKNRYGVDEWRSIEEVYYPNMIIRRTSPKSRPYDRNDVWFLLSNRTYVNLNTKYYSSRAQNRMKRLTQTHPRSLKLFIELFKLFDHVQVSNEKVDGLFRGDVSPAHKRCRDFSPAMITFNNGSIVVFRPVFEKMDALSVEILYIHESIRFAQTFHPSFHDMTDKELQLLTSLFFLNRTQPAKFKAILDKFEQRLEIAAYKLGVPRSLVLPNNVYDTQIVFRHKFQEALYYDEENIGTILNDFRINDQEFKKHSYMDTMKAIKSSNR